MQNKRNNLDYIENTKDHSVDFDLLKIDAALIDPENFIEVIKALNSYIIKKATVLSIQISLMDDKERIAYLGRAQEKSWREIGREIGIDKNTAQEYFHIAKQKITQFTNGE